MAVPDSIAPGATELADRIEDVRDRIARAAERAGRRSSDVTIVAVSKTVSRDVVVEAYRQGLTHFGENRVQQAAQTFTPPMAHDIRLHLIGQLQSNKARQALRVAHVIESVDRMSLIEKLDVEAAKLVDVGELAAGTILPVLLQINMAGEEQKAGCTPEEANELVEAILGKRHLRLDGVMTIAPLVTDPEDTRIVFAGLRELRDDLVQRYPEAKLATLSMGMTNDFSIAIAEGASHVRIGRAIFGG